ncbi:MAG: RagB/SusD family nutrient uptake outer membrane protein [Odoribacter splanchnicus]
MKKIIYMLILAGMTVSCGDWLDVKPYDQISEEQQYEKAQGFYNQLNGIYHSMASSELYGKELSWGFMDVLAQYYDMSSYSPWEDKAYRELANLEYDYERVKPYFAVYWEKMYNIIANCNNLVQNIAEADSTLFPQREKERRCIEGEARALRGLLHFDLLRMFAPAPKVDATGAYIPYVDFFPTHITMKMETNQVLDKIIGDLERGHELTMNYDTTYIQLITDLGYRLELLTGGNINSFMNHRGYRLNHYAIKALLARVNMWKGDKAEALKWAGEMMDLVKKRWFDFTLEYTIKNKNMKLYDDVLFALYNNNLPLYESQTNEGKYQLVAWDYNCLFDSDGERDFRRHQWKYNENEDYWQPLKYKKQEENGTEAEVSNLMIPMVRCSEMCYIMAECSWETDRTAAESYLNYIRQKRGCRSSLEPADTQEKFNKLILRDFRREFYGEGQLFFFYKRLGLEGIRMSNTTIKYDNKFVFPIPESDDI